MAVNAEITVVGGDILFHIEPHIHVVARAHRFSERIPPKLDFHFQRQVGLHAAFCDAAVIEPYDGPFFRAHAGDAHAGSRKSGILPICRNPVLRLGRTRV